MENKVYFITGASSDVGQAFLKNLDERMAKEGKRAAVLAQYASNKKELDKLAQTAKAMDITLIRADFTVAEDVNNMIETVKTCCGCPDHILHLPAGKLSYGRVKQFDTESFERDMDIQVNSFARIGREFLPLMAKRHDGRVVVMLSSCTLGMPPKFMSQYVTVKYALLGLMKSMAVEYADKGVRVNGLSPNMMETKFLENVNEKIVELNRENCALKRNVRPDEAVSAIEFLFSDGASYLNGVNLNLTGGDK